ncbi:MAG: glycosyltransferase family 2 protein [bacterium]|nr:glycosyltransferase family 2 protein [bacterium]
MQPKVSFCSTVFNNADTIKQCVESLLKFKEYNIPFEIVIVDNYSTDGTWEILQQYKQKYPEIFRIKQYRCDRGTGRRLANLLAHGDIIVTFDCDTYYPKIMLDMVARIMKIIQPNEIYYAIATIIYQRSLVQKINFRAFNWGEDRDFIRQAFIHGIKVYYIAILNALNQEVVVREKRYVKSYFKFARRMLKNFLQLYRIQNPTLKEGIKHIIRKRSYKKVFGFLFSPFGLLIKLLRLTYYPKSLEIETLERYNQKQYIILLPADLALDNNYMLYFTYFASFARLFEQLLKNRVIRYEKYTKGGLYIYVPVSAENWIKEHVLKITII